MGAARFAPLPIWFRDINSYTYLSFYSSYPGAPFPSLSPLGPSLFSLETKAHLPLGHLVRKARSGEEIRERDKAKGRAREAPLPPTIPLNLGRPPSSLLLILTSPCDLNGSGRASQSEGSTINI